MQRSEIPFELFFLINGAWRRIWCGFIHFSRGKIVGSPEDVQGYKFVL